MVIKKKKKKILVSSGAGIKNSVLPCNLLFANGAI